MANAFLTSDFMLEAAQDAAILLQSNTVASQLCQRDVETTLANGVATVGQSGGTVKVKYRPVLDATLDETTAGRKTLETSQNQQTSVTVDATKYVHVLQDLDTKEATYEVADFTREIIAPAIPGIAEKIDQYFIRKFAGGFARNLTGTAGTAPSTIAHIIAGRKKLNDNKVPMPGRVSIVGTTPEASFLQLDQFVNADYGADGPSALREAMLTRRYGIEFYMDQNAGTFNRGDVAGTIAVVGSNAAGASSLAVDGFTAATGTVKQGTRFTIAGNATVYTVTADTAIASNAATLPVTPALAATASNDVVVTMQAAFTQDLMYNADAAAGAIVAPAPLRGTPSAVASYGGMSIRLSMVSGLGTAGAVDQILLDVFIGAEVIRPEMGVVFQGG